MRLAAWSAFKTRNISQTACSSRFLRTNIKTLRLQYVYIHMKHYIATMDQMRPNCLHLFIYPTENRQLFITDMLIPGECLFSYRSRFISEIASLFLRNTCCATSNPLPDNWLNFQNAPTLLCYR